MTFFIKPKNKKVEKVPLGTKHMDFGVIILRGNKSKSKKTDTCGYIYLWNINNQDLILAKWGKTILALCEKHTGDQSGGGRREEERSRRQVIGTAGLVEGWMKQVYLRR